ncbi:MAG: hypothetical protein D4S01_05730 [Dehalococcoidia bacterium]|nr:MAG: hypothetical protein D4S01_05730 [Dehalococcoidia bacterium]
MAEETDKYVEIDGVKYQENPEKEGEALLGEDENPIPFEEKDEESETPEQKEAREKKEKEDEDEEPPMRKSVKDYIIERKEKKIEKLKAKKDDDGEYPDNPDEDEVTSKGKDAIRKEVEGAIKPILDTVRGQSDDRELKDVFAKYPDSEKMEKQIRKYMDAYKDAPIEFIYLGLAAKKMEIQKKRDKADADSKGDKTGGHGKRPTAISSIPDVRNYTDKQMDELLVQVKTGQFK